jgi:hypothetical protein
MDSISNNATFWLSLTGILAGMMGLVITAINKSKCSNVDCCCGMIRCIREVDLEVELEEHKIDHNVPDTPTNKV